MVRTLIALAARVRCETPTACADFGQWCSRYSSSWTMLDASSILRGWRARNATLVKGLRWFLCVHRAKTATGWIQTASGFISTHRWRLYAPLTSSLLQCRWIIGRQKTRCIRFRDLFNRSLFNWTKHFQSTSFFLEPPTETDSTKIIFELNYQNVWLMIIK